MTPVFGFFLILCCFCSFPVISRRRRRVKPPRISGNHQKHPQRSPTKQVDHPSLRAQVRSRRHRDSRVAVLSSLAFRRRMSEPRGRKRKVKQLTRPKPDDGVVLKSTCRSPAFIQSKEFKIMVVHHHHSRSSSHRLCRREAARRPSTRSANTATARNPFRNSASGLSPRSDSRPGAWHAATSVEPAIGARKRTGGQFRRGGRGSARRMTQTQHNPTRSARCVAVGGTGNSAQREVSVPPTAPLTNSGHCTTNVPTPKT